MNEANQKAKELVERFENIEILKEWEGMYLELAKQCALIACDEIIDQFNEGSNNIWASGKIDYWQSVKQEITKL